MFRFPGNAKQNYIKRLVGLPNELVKIWRGNVYTTPLLFRLRLGHQGAIAAGLVSDELRQAFARHDVPLGNDASIPFGSEISPSTIEPHNGWAKQIFSANDTFIIAQHEGELHGLSRSVPHSPPSRRASCWQCCKWSTMPSM